MSTPPPLPSVVLQDPDLLSPSTKIVARRISFVAGVVAAAIGVIVLLGWWLHLPILTHVILDRISMKAVTALSFVCIGTALALIQANRGPPWLRREVPVLLALATTTLAILSLVQSMAGVDFGIDQLLVRDEEQPADTIHPGRMAEATAGILVVLGPAVAGLALGWFGAVSRWACWAGMVIAFHVIAIQFYGRSVFHLWPGMTSVAIPTALALLCLSTGMLLARPRDGLTTMILADSPGGQSIRRLLPWAILLPLAFGWLRLFGEEAGYYETRFGVAMSTSLLIMSIVGVVLASSRILHRADTARREAERKVRDGERLLHAVLDAWDAIIYVKDTAGRFVLANRSIADAVGRSAESVTGLTAFDLVSREEAERQEALDRRVLFSNATLAVEHAGEVAGQPRMHLESRSPLRDAQGQPWAVCTVVTDITDKHRHFVEIERVNADLRNMTGRLAESVEELTSFSYSVSHDLRAPLRAVDGFARALEEDAGPHLDEQGRGHLARIRAGCRTMGTLIDGLLVLARVTRAELVLVPVDLTQIAGGIVAQLRDTDPSRSVDVTIATGLSTVGDVRLLRSALENLIGNAWKFTSGTGKARIEVGSFAGADDVRVFFVRDNGAGFDPAYADKLFAPFQRLHARAEFDGTGIGLATVARIVRRHGGRIWAEGSPGHGATFYFTIGAGVGIDTAKGAA